MNYIQGVFEMENDDFYELFYSNLRKELGDDKFVNGVEKLIGKNKLTKSNFIKLVKEEIR